MKPVSTSHITRLRLTVCAFVCALCLVQGRAQSDAQFTQYYEVPAYYNPGAVGQTDYISIHGGGRLQWVGIDHAPKSFMLAADSPFKLLGKRVGAGVVLAQESIGLYKTMNLNAQLAYKFKRWGGEFTVGLDLGLFDQSFKGSDVILPDDDDYHQGTDDGVPTQDLHGTALDLGAGIWYRHKHFWAGFSGLHLNQPAVTLNGDNGDTSTDRTYEYTVGRTLYFMAGGNIALKNTLFEILPSVLVKSDLTFTTAEITARARYNKMFSFGLGYRWNDAVSVLLAAEIKNFYVGYSYDYPVNALSKASTGSHELFAGYRLKLDLGDRNRNRHKAIRIM